MNLNNHYINQDNSFGLESIIAIKKFGSKIKFLNEDKLSYYFSLTPDNLENLFQK